MHVEKNTLTIGYGYRKILETSSKQARNGTFKVHEIKQL